MIIRAIILSSALLLAGCAGPEGQPPSLSSRSIEGILDEPIRGIAPLQSSDDAALAGQIDVLVAQAEAGNTVFTSEYPITEIAIAEAAGSAVESEAWIVAQISVSALDSARSETVRALGALDAILADQALNAAPSETVRLLEAREHVAMLYDAQNTRYDRLQAQLRTP